MICNFISRINTYFAFNKDISCSSCAFIQSTFDINTILWYLCVTSKKARKKYPKSTIESKTKEERLSAVPPFSKAQRRIDTGTQSIRYCRDYFRPIPRRRLEQSANRWQHAPQIKKGLLFNKVEKGRRTSENLEVVAKLIGVSQFSNNLPYYWTHQKGWKTLNRKAIHSRSIASKGIGINQCFASWWWIATTCNVSERIRIYQLFVRHFSNFHEESVYDGSIEENGCGSFRGISAQALTELRQMGITHKMISTKTTIAKAMTPSCWFSILYSFRALVLVYRKWQA